MTLVLFSYNVNFVANLRSYGTKQKKNAVVEHNIKLKNSIMIYIFSGIISISSKGLYCYPESNKDEDIKAAERFLQFFVSRFK